ncbi:MAG: NADH-quinone oxidoreductase subunit NuoK [Candidatus Marinimicrobia bacterium]|nr:NADH-quinone oxidoreductase subunit NuoK [Candidatus Neomarinimicrobiota bacterium]
MASLESYLFISLILFCLGLYAVMTRRNGVAVLMGIELILNAANLNLVAFNRFGGLAEHLPGQVFALFVIVMAASEAAVALAIIINLYKTFATVNVDEAHEMKW